MRPALFIFIMAVFLGCSDKRLVGMASEEASFAQSGMSSEEIEMFKATNQQRLVQGLGPLEVSSTCVRAAQEHAFDMVRRGYFSHDSPNESFSQRMNRYGLLGTYVGENIARGSEDVSTILNMWMNSSGHRANILNAQYRSLGIGKFQDHWVQCFSGRTGDL